MLLKKMFEKLLEVKSEAGTIANRKELAYVFNDYVLKTAENLNIKNTDQTMATKLLKKILA
jgi:hypothetical protein